MEREEGEMSDDEPMMVDDKLQVQEQQHALVYKADKAGIIVEQLEKVDVSKLEERAKRFGINLSSNKIVSQKNIDDLYNNFGIKGDNLRHFRCDTLHLSHIQDLTTKDIFEYLQDYKPISLEWVNEDSCNVVCQDHIAAALALLVHSREINNEELKVMLRDNSNYHWREGFPHPKNDLILMRFATNGDKKIPKNERKNDRNINVQLNDEYNLKKNPWGDLCQSWGVYDHQEIFYRSLPKHDYENSKEENKDKHVIKNKKMALRLGKRHSTKKNDSDSEPECKSGSEKKPRMRMHADDEELKQKDKSESLEKYEDNYLPLCVEVVNLQNEFKPKKMINLSDKFKSYNLNRKHNEKESIQSRLGEKISLNEEEDLFSDTKHIQNKPNNQRSDESKSVWLRLEKKSESSKSKNDLREKLKTKKKPHDLRTLIHKSKQKNIRIEIDNN